MIMIGKMVEANFADDTITLEMQGDYQAAAGAYAVMPSVSAHIIRELVAFCLPRLGEAALDELFRGQPLEVGIRDALKFLSPATVWATTVEQAPGGDGDA